MQGHAGANLTPIVAANRIGHEVGHDSEREITFYGSSFIADPTGAKVAETGRDDEAVITASFDLDELRSMRHGWGLFRDRRPDLYQPLMTLDGNSSTTGLR
jgi:N-carbamoylputrescine amidase